MFSSAAPESAETFRGFGGLSRRGPGTVVNTFGYFCDLRRTAQEVTDGLRRTRRYFRISASLLRAVSNARRSFSAEYGLSRNDFTPKPVSASIFSF